MVKKLESSVLKDMTLSDLKKHAKRLRRDGYPISGYSKLSDTPSDMSTLRKMIRRAQKAGKSSGSSPKASSPKKRSGCSADFENVTHCQKKTSAKKVKELAEECGIEYTTKEKTCRALLALGVDVGGGGGGGSPKKKKKSSSKTPSSAINQTDAYKKLNKLKKKDNNGPDLQDKARKLKITYADQDGENISMGKLRKHELILAILKKKGKGSISTPTPPKKKSKKKKKRTPSPVKDALQSMSRKELRKVLREAGLTTFPKDKQGMIDYLNAVNNNGRCDPEEGQWCNGEFVCDINNKPGVCLSPSQAQGFDEWEYQGKKMVGTADAISALKQAMKPKKSKKKKLKDTRPQGDLPDPWSAEGLKRKNLINQVSLATGRSKSFYKDWQVEDLRNRLEGLEVEKERMLTQSEDQARADEIEARLIMINQIVAITGEDPSVYKGYNFDEVMDKLNSLQDEEYIEEASSSKSSDDEDTPTPPPKMKKKKPPTPVSSSSESSDSSDDEDTPTPPPKMKKKKPPTPVSSSSESSDSSDDEDSDRPDEDTEIVDVESTLANVIAGNKQIGELAKVQRSILKCMGLLS